MKPIPASGPMMCVCGSVIAGVLPPAVVEYESTPDRLESLKNARPAAGSIARPPNVGYGSNTVRAGMTSTTADSSSGQSYLLLAYDFVREPPAGAATASLPERRSFRRHQTHLGFGLRAQQRLQRVRLDELLMASASHHQRDDGAGTK